MTYRKFTHSTSSILSLIFVASFANADVLVTLDDDGSGNTMGTITGSFFINPLSETINPSGVVDDFQLIGNGVRWSRRSTPTTTSFFSPTYSGNPDNGPILANGFFAVPTQLSIDNFTFVIQTNSSANRALFESSDGAHIGQNLIKESFNYAVPFSSFNPGTYEWGEFGGGPSNGVRLQIGASTVPEPSIVPMSILLCLSFCYVRNRNEKCGTSTAKFVGQ